MKLRNLCLALGLTGLGLIIGSTSAQALTWDFNYSYNNGGTVTGTGQLSYNGSGNNQTFSVTSLSFS